MNRSLNTTAKVYLVQLLNSPVVFKEFVGFRSLNTTAKKQCQIQM